MYPCWVQLCVSIMYIEAFLGDSTCTMECIKWNSVLKSMLWKLLQTLQVIFLILKIDNCNCYYHFHNSPKRQEKLLLQRNFILVLQKQITSWKEHGIYTDSREAFKGISLALNSSLSLKLCVFTLGFSSYTSHSGRLCIHLNYAWLLCNH